MNLLGVYDYTVILTYMSLLSAVFGMLQAVKGNFGIAVMCVAVSGICDAFDGAVARTKKDRTEDEKGFGIQLDSLVDVISFGFVPAFLCYFMGVNGVVGTSLVFLYILCALIRLAFFNVLEAKRQKTQTGSNKVYRGLPVTSIAIIFPIVYLLRFVLSADAFLALLHVMLSVVAFLFVLDFRVQKPNWDRFLQKKDKEGAVR